MVESNFNVYSSQDSPLTISNRQTGEPFISTLAPLRARVSLMISSSSGSRTSLRDKFRQQCSCLLFRVSMGQVHNAGDAELYRMSKKNPERFPAAQTPFVKVGNLAMIRWGVNGLAQDEVDIPVCSSEVYQIGDGSSPATLSTKSFSQTSSRSVPLPSLTSG